MRGFAAVLAAALLFVSSAGAETFVSNKYGFSADFPISPVVAPEQNSETNDSGKVISRSAEIKAESTGVYTALVTVDSYIVPTKIDAASTLRTMVRMFVAQLEARATLSKPGKLDGFPARYFGYETPDHQTAGDGVAVIVPGKLPRIYLVVTMHTAMASPDEVASLTKFVKSFHFN
jgi:hypothetical protein